MKQEVHKDILKFIEESMANSREEVTDELCRNSLINNGLTELKVGRSTMSVHTEALIVDFFVRLQLYTPEARGDNDKPVCDDYYRVSLGHDGQFLGCQTVHFTNSEETITVKGE